VASSPKRAANCGPGFPASLVYDPVLRPNGVRCDLLDPAAEIRFRLEQLGAGGTVLVGLVGELHRRRLVGHGAS